MFRLLLYLSAVFALPGAVAVRTEDSSEFNISSCPVMFYGQTYDQIYINITSENIAMCFNGFYNPQTGGDCLLGPKVDKAYFEVHERSSVLEQQIQENVPNIKTRMQCYVYFELWSENTVAQLSIGNFGRQAALKLGLFLTATVTVDIHVNNTSMDTLTVTNPSDNIFNVDYADISGCRYSGLVHKPGSVLTSFPETCTSFMCSETAVLQNTTCGPLEHCQGNGSCLLHAICTVTGPSVIDFYGQLDYVRDRCVYSLLEITPISNFRLLAKFQERRRKDVSFLDSVKLQLNNVSFHLKQGGRVLVDDTALDLSLPQMVDGVMISKDNTGVSAKVSISNFAITVFFDGYSAHILAEGLGGSPLKGLCQNSSEPRIPEISPVSCQIQYNNTDDCVINCTEITKHCNLLQQAPFTSCGIDPEPYISACTGTLCTYPAVDGLKCQFLEAYVRACSLYSNNPLDGWRSKADCPLPEAFCWHQTCSDHEFCGEKSHCGETRCFCRPIFASSYRERNTLGDPPVCKKNSASINLVNCLLEDNNIDYSDLHLNDPTCTGRLDEQTHLVTFSYIGSKCGTQIKLNDSQIIYQNTITSQNTSSDMILHSDPINIDFSCYLNQPYFNSLALSYQDVMAPGTYNSSTDDSSGSQLITRLEESQEIIRDEDDNI